MENTDLPYDWKMLFLSSLDNSEEKTYRLDAIKDFLNHTYDMDVISTNNEHDFLEVFYYQQNISAIFIEYKEENKNQFKKILADIRKRNQYIPIVAFSEERKLNSFDCCEFKDLSDFYFLYADTIDFLAGRLMDHSKKYIENVLSPFLKQLIKYSHKYKYAWHTPGHMGGCAFIKNPPGKFFYDFLGENVFRTDLSISVPELGSLLDHEGSIGDSEKFAAQVFGADQTYYVLNGTSSVNQIIWKGRVTKGDLAYVDRNCHKSLNYAMVVSEAIPTYIIPRRNGLGIIGPVRLNEFKEDGIKLALHKNPLVSKEKNKERIKMMALTNSTYDGLCYNANKIKEVIGCNMDNIHFDEAWYAYAKFHPIYKNHYAMSEDENIKWHPPIFASQSTHKLLAAFSQSSMLHIKNGTEINVDPEIFNEAYMMYGSTSPQYNMIASLDVSAKMMEFNGQQLMHETICDAIDLRKNIKRIYNCEKAKNSWFFNVWQPVTTEYENKEVAFENAPTEFLAKDQKTWILNKKDLWHGFEDIEDDYVMLDPIKITLKMPGLNADGKFEECGIPASILSDYLISYGVVPEKTDYYSLLLLNSIGTTKGKQGTLFTALTHFKKLYDENAPLEKIFPELIASYKDRYKSIGLRDHCQMMHEYIKNNNMLELMDKAFQVIPTPEMTPAEASRRVFKGEVFKLPINELMGQIAAVMMVPYPPGIPILMGGEKVDEVSKPIIDYLLTREAFEREFPGYYSDIHGVEAIVKDGKRIFTTMALK
ncbi:Orn/Lys/Arg decarboxylase N-terminal domain-containing protein [Clostridium tarantellae]|uniref:Orn/Lys/Arg decarboxylases family 1 pyridoxal-P attachment site domain-containing protein n=1 Tax=Clostridium tarantellae TaxID=39493 RepID=A0A6I1MR57_9CLOT|nr:Orn/Lys/Arg decarboxylase N-terminal domain-containing protein [Clostridium tarantellae]MPQ44657.1 hypothetical protein [Clostridium tarantellae]